MARIKWVQQRLENWAIWASRGGLGGSGYARESVLASWTTDDVWSRGRYSSGALIPAMEEDALEIDRAITSFKDTRRQLAEALVLVYIRNLGVLEAAHRARVASSTMHARLDQADQAIAMWLEDRAAERVRLQAQARAQVVKNHSAG